MHLRETFAISYGNFEFRDALVVTLEHAGKTGYGECVQITYYGIDLEQFIVSLQKIKTFLESQQIISPPEFFKKLLAHNLHPFLLSALDCAYWDLFGKLENRSFAEINGFIPDDLPESSFTISIAPVEEQVLKIEKSSWKKFKVKCNAYSPEHVQALLNTGKEIALDANAGFSEGECLQLETTLFAEKLLYVEQPLPPGNFENLSRNSAVNWMADEDCQNINSLEKLQPHYKTVNIKLMKCGGLTPALELIKEAKKLGFRTMIGCMTESSTGISAGIAIAPLCDYADLDGANLIANDYAAGSSVKDGILIPNHEPGLGIRIV